MSEVDIITSPSQEEASQSGFNVDTAFRLSNLAGPAFLKPEVFNEWAESQGYEAWRAIEAGELQAKVLYKDGAITIVFPGTDLGREIKEFFKYDMPIWQVEAPFAGKIHKGFRDAIHARDNAHSPDLMQQIYTAVNDIQQEYGENLPIEMTGNSMGGALTKVFLQELLAAERDGVNVPISSSQIKAVYTTGEPKSGDAAYAKALDDAFGSVLFRGVNNNDIVPHLPPGGAYAHSGQPHFIDSEGKIQAGRGEQYMNADALARQLNYLLAPFVDHVPHLYAEAYAVAAGVIAPEERTYLQELAHRAGALFNAFDIMDGVTSAALCVTAAASQKDSLADVAHAKGASIQVGQ